MGDESDRFLILEFKNWPFPSNVSRGNKRWRILSTGQQQLQHVAHHKNNEDAAKDPFLVNRCNQPLVFTSAAAKEMVARTDGKGEKRGKGRAGEALSRVSVRTGQREGIREGEEARRGKTERRTGLGEESIRRRKGDDDVEKKRAQT
ncbi:unnamed protein product [Pleuronectes platessa]|uniref:Uncharacterized protein n=1 Tax=Pleuronectes platessa TaxID=8262 RepID=A0A9N7VR49_PLEPL|nr:unnamed protein product [Pleuronectes platessa]